MSQRGLLIAGRQYFSSWTLGTEELREKRARSAGVMLALLELARVSSVAICNPKRQRLHLWGLLGSWASWVTSYRFMERLPQ